MRHGDNSPNRNFYIPLVLVMNLPVISYEFGTANHWSVAGLVLEPSNDSLKLVLKIVDMMLFISYLKFIISN